MVKVQKCDKSTFCALFPKVCMLTTREVLKTLKYPFRFWFLTNYSLSVVILKAQYGSDTNIRGSECRCISKLLKNGKGTF